MTERPVRPVGRAWARAVLRLAGWQLVFDGLPAQQGVFIGYPHTSNWDFVLALFFKLGAGFPAHFWAKDSLFRVPLFGRWLRWMGGLPVDRSGPHGMVGAMVARFAAARESQAPLWLALTPEGTRSLQPHWRSGFHQLALQAGVPVGLVFFDYGRKRVGVEHFLMLSEDAAADMAVLATCYQGVRGRRPELAAPVRLP
ncbi:1-acyl-sn-glycerol-3-phosphate acyltransferase [Ideonella sp. 4Y11]|uniref:1-acyl-sn-glycerol-3-phosphate acyltransferase n=1 Tax=Ideonella aquatica TaxID=2824119 RepID=A0A941BJJ6_9BURK|nr:1-acyl-sn-glycerol-3-phosphate acyltransferase [Ideonella aquatica]MBQ0959592.1 1-acyl-sn-glycerol-3-phosphate acyltransferase [Ideonella aquatica]